MTYEIITLGCKVNSCESAAIAAHMERAGYTPAQQGADVCIINSCAVTGTGVKKARQTVSRCKRENPACIVVLCGCFPQAYPEEASRVIGADIVTGNSYKGDIPALVAQRLGTGVRTMCVQPLTRDFDENSAGADIDRTRAFIKVEDGCDRFCTYCIIPFARGRVRSRRPEEIARQAALCAESGHREVVLTGINLGCYGQEYGLTLADAVSAAQADGIERIRLSSLEPEMLTADEVERLRGIKKLCPHFHLSLQSGCDKTLRDMHRRYDTELFAQTAQRLREAFPGCAITTDIMVGFPGETDEDFAQSMAFIEQIGFAKLHVFPYSIRQGTVAAERPDQTPPMIKTRRTRLAEELGRQLEERFLSAQVGTVQSVLIEKPRTPDYSHGFTAGYTPVRIYGAELARHTLVTVRITGFRDGYCIGTPDSPAE